MDQSVSPPWTDPTRSEHIASLIGALSKAQADIKSPDRNRAVEVRTKAGGTYKFKYATLDHIIEAVRKPLTDNGLWFTQIIKHEAGMYLLDTRLLHSSGEWMASQTPILVQGNSNQDFGSALTFMKRYALTSLLGISAEDDDDANSADGNSITNVIDKTPAPPQPDVMSQADLDGVREHEHPQPPGPILVPMLEDGSGSDWVAFGRKLMASIRSSRNDKEGELWRGMNQLPLEQMEKVNPKAFTNLSMAMVKQINELKRKANAQQ